MSDAEHYLRKAEEWAEAARRAESATDRESCLQVERSFRALAETCARLAQGGDAPP